MTGGGLVLLLASCSGAVALEPPDPAVNADACGNLMSALPNTIDSQSTRATDPVSDLTAAYGDPAITVRCGVPDPEALTPEAQLFTVNGIDWFPEQSPTGYVFTTYRLRTNVEVAVPVDYAPEVEALTPISKVVKATIAPRDEN